MDGFKHQEKFKKGTYKIFFLRIAFKNQSASFVVVIAYSRYISVLFAEPCGIKL